ncbi:WD repeat-containing protein 18 [Coccinella septempunctata]|uniref:WD repeat-containing protein 18 n=1 Tax=Coccinella septempunctata TaxID=41139 RepID=UPI001D072852|nr:WD repeat-containing protein 18 [Coccinella septempunctata]
MDVHEVLLSTCENNKPSAINLWDYKTTNSLFQYRNGGPIGRHMIAQLKNDYLIGAHPEEPKLYLWQLNSHDPSKNIRLILPEVATCLSVCPHGLYLAVGIKTNLYIWHLPSGKLLTIQKKNVQKITVVKFSACGSLVIVGSEDGSLSTYKLVHLVSLHKNDLSHREVGQTEPLYSRSDHNGAILDIQIGSFALRTKVATCSLDQTVKIYKLSTGTLIHNIITEHPVYSFIADCMFHNGYIGCSNGVLLTFTIPTSNNYHLTSEEIETKNLSLEGHTKTVKCLSLNQKGDILASGGDDGTIMLWNTISKKHVSFIKLNSPITNLRFTVNHQNIWSQNFDVTTAVVDLEMTFNLSNTNFKIMVLNNAPIGSVKRKWESVKEKEEIEKLEKENTNLRATNQQMYKFILDLLKNKDDKK